MADTADWQGPTGQAWAEEWRRTDRSFTGLTERLLQRSRDFAFSSMLDVGCGAGELSLAIARGRPRNTVVGIDISPDLVAAARRRSGNLANVTFECADAATWQQAAEFRPQLLASRHGVMFFDDSAAAFANLADLAADGAGLMFSCFRDPSENPFFTEVARLLRTETGALTEDAPGPFRFADRRIVETMLGRSGWRSIAFESFDFAMIVGAGKDPVEDALAYYGSIGPAARAAAGLEPDQLAQFQDRLRALAERHLSEGIVALRAGAWIVTARRA